MIVARNWEKSGKNKRKGKQEKNENIKREN